MATGHHNPAESAEQYGLALAVATGKAKHGDMPKSVAKEIIRSTPPSARSRFARELAEKRSATRMEYRNPHQVPVRVVWGPSVEGARGQAQQSGEVLIVADYDGHVKGIIQPNGHHQPNPDLTLSLVQAADGAGEKSGRDWSEYKYKKASITAIKKEFHHWFQYRKSTMTDLAGISQADKSQLQGAFIRGFRRGAASPNPSKKDISKRLKVMKVGQLSIQVGDYVVTRPKRKEWCLGELGGDWLMHGTAEQVADRIIRGRRSNPNINDLHGETADAAELYRIFHGKDAEEIVEVTEEHREHDALATVGPLCEICCASLTGKDVIVHFDYRNGEEPIRMASSPDGRQLYFVGGCQELDLKAFGMDGDKWFRDHMVLGVLYELTYETRKKFDKFKLIDYYHELGEETGDMPMLTYDTMNKRFAVVGGAYVLKAPGIIN